MEKVYSVEDVAEILQVKALTVREMFRENRLRAFKIGKAWRTTESILQADLEALARGESPAEIPMPGAPVAAPAKAAQKVGKAPPPPAQAPIEREESSPSSEEAEVHKKKCVPEETDEDDTQQLLF